MNKVLLFCSCVLSGSTVRPAVTTQGPLVPSPCSTKQFSCASGECVHLDRRCDLQKDCVDGSDEKDCGKIYSMPTSKVIIRLNKASHLISFPFLSSSGLHHVPVDSVECLQCVLWSGLLVSAERHTEGSSARRGLWWSSV